MSINTKTAVEGIEPTTANDEPATTLTLIVRKSTQYQTLPDWNVVRYAEWAIQDTIERVAPEAEA